MALCFQFTPQLHFSFPRYGCCTGLFQGFRDFVGLPPDRFGGYGIRPVRRLPWSAHSAGDAVFSLRRDANKATIATLLNRRPGRICRCHGRPVIGCRESGVILRIHKHESQWARPSSDCRILPYRRLSRSESSRCAIRGQVTHRYCASESRSSTKA